MEVSVKSAGLFLTIFITGLSAGFFYAWQVSVIPGTKQISDRSYLETMQSVNRAILNPAFFIVFLGSVLLLATSCYMQYRAAVNLSFWLLLAATLTYLAGTLGITMVGNVPLNDMLDAVNLRDLKSEPLIDIRRSYEGGWNQWHSIRTTFSLLSFAFCLLAVFIEKSTN